MSDDDNSDQPIVQLDRSIPEIQYEFLDHPADVQLHAWGDTLDEAFEQVTIAMFAYITDITTVSIESHIDVEVEGIDMLSLLYQLMDEFLFNFCAEPYFVPRVSKFAQPVLPIRSADTASDFLIESENLGI